MSDLHFHLFGKFRVERNARPIKGLEAGKEQELLSYLLINRERAHPRETLASLLWGETSTDRSKKYLRQALWHLQTSLRSKNDKHSDLLLVEHDWIQLNSNFWLDVAEFEDVFASAEGVPGHQLESKIAGAMQKVVRLYQGDLLAGCYQDWCLYERERLQNMYLSMLDKLVEYCKEHSDYERGQLYGSTILHYDRARERTHRQLMEVHYLAGDRTAAFRQYKRCVTALDEELGVGPERRTVLLYERICANQEIGRESSQGAGTSGAEPLPEVLGRLRKLHVILTAVQRRVQRDIRAVEGMKPDKR
jgi:DNA-binding SARP family transcriptional activator